MTSRNPSKTHDIPRSTSTSGPSARRNLFISNRRPSANPNASSSSSTQVVHTDASASKDDIIVRDEHGNFKLDLPNMTPLPRDEAKEEQEQQNQVIEAYRKHKDHIDSNELRTALQASLNAKVASLEEDKWMFGEEEDEVPLTSGSVPLTLNNSKVVWDSSPSSGETTLSGHNIILPVEAGSVDANIGLYQFDIGVSTSGSFQFRQTQVCTELGHLKDQLR